MSDHDADHDHEIKIKGGSFALSDLGHLLPGMAEIMPLVGGPDLEVLLRGQGPEQGAGPLPALRGGEPHGEGRHPAPEVRRGHGEVRLRHDGRRQEVHRGRGLGQASSPRSRR